MRMRGRPQCNRASWDAYTDPRPLVSPQETAALVFLYGGNGLVHAVASVHFLQALFDQVGGAGQASRRPPCPSPGPFAVDARWRL